ncbi:MAG TPA: DUF4389 domain-containing protein [Streptosporangiaceae bacterium]|nr:DUF4389 domain-containing protein [Streptosporangiaceae bacterium]
MRRGSAQWGWLRWLDDEPDATRLVEARVRAVGVVAVAAVQGYPVRVDASLDVPLSRWLWLVKWLLLIPHYIVLGFLWMAFVVLSAVAFFAILFTGTYPRGIFDFNVGVLRWTWRVQYYAIGAFGTDRYPPFSLADDPSYPAHLEIAYPERLSRGLVLVKWWLLAIPQYIIVGLFTGGGVWFAWRLGNDNANGSWPGLIGILAIVAAVVLLVTGRYPQQIFDFVLGLNRWVLRVAAYAGLMTDQYPPFRLDMGGHDPGSALTLPQPPTGQSPPVAPQQPGPAAQRPSGWTPGRIICVVAGAVLTLCSLGLLGAGAAAWWADTGGRHAGYIDLGTATYSTGGYAVASDTVELHASGPGWDAAQAFLGTVRIRATSASGAAPVFIGIAPAGPASRYLSGVAYATVSGVAGQRGLYTVHSGTAPVVPPARAGIWTIQAAGAGTQTLAWRVRSGSWTVVAMNADGSRPVSVRVNLAATLPALPWLITGLLIGGIIVLGAGALLIAIPARGASRRPAPAKPVPGQ